MQLRISASPILSLLIISGAAGFALGSFQHATWQLAVESAQVLAGLVEYGTENPFFMHHTKLWSLLHQMSALLLLAGISERTLSLLLSGIISMLFFQALSLTVWALCKNVLLGLAAPIFIVFTHATKYCAIYPIVLLGTSNTHGAIGLALVLLIFALMGSGRYGAAAFLLGIIPAVHLSLGALCWMVILVCFLYLSREMRNRFGPKRIGFILGFCLTLASLAVHFLWGFDQPHLSMSEGARFVHTFVQNWDSHRIPIPWTNPGLLINLGVLGLTATWILKHREERETDSYIFLFSLLVASVLGIIFALLSRVPQDRLPLFLIVMMPARILELNVLAFVALLIGLAGRVVPFRQSKIATQFLRVALIILVGFMTVRFMLHPNQFRQEPEEWNNFSLGDDSVLAEASKEKTLLLTGSDLHLIQLRTRRPVLLDGGQLDTLPYTYESGPEMSRILLEVYGVDFFHPPLEARRTARIRVHAHRNLWEKRSTADWQKLAKKYRFTQVLTYQNWTLALPDVVQNENFVLYQIPLT